MRRFTKLSLRALFILVTLCCIAAAWVSMEMRRFREQAVLLKELEKRLAGGYQVETIPARPEWLWRPLVGDEGVEVWNATLLRRDPVHSKAIGPTADEAKLIAKWSKVSCLFVGGDGITDEFLGSFHKMPQLFNVWLMDTKVTSRGIAQLRDLNDLTVLKIEATEGVPTEGKELTIRADAIAALAKLPKLRDLMIEGYVPDDSAVAALPHIKHLDRLFLQRADIADADVPSIAQVPVLEGLFLRDNPQISDVSIDALGTLSHLKQLELRGTAVTVDGLEHLVKAIPQFDQIRPEQDDLFINHELDREMVKRRTPPDPDDLAGE